MLKNPCKDCTEDTGYCKSNCPYIKKYKELLSNNVIAKFLFVVKSFLNKRIHC